MWRCSLLAPGSNPSISVRKVGFAESRSKRTDRRGEEGKMKTLLNTGRQKRTGEERMSVTGDNGRGRELKQDQRGRDGSGWALSRRILRLSKLRRFKSVFKCFSISVESSCNCLLFPSGQVKEDVSGLKGADNFPRRRTEGASVFPVSWNHFLFVLSPPLPLDLNPRTCHAWSKCPHIWRCWTVEVC